MVAALGAVVALCLAQQPLATVRITVIDGQSAAPVADVRLELIAVSPKGAPNRTARTDAAGQVAFDALGAGTYAVTASTIGYIFIRRHFGISAGETLDLTIPLSEGTGTYQESITVAADPMRVKTLGVGSQMELGSAGLQDLRGVASDDPMRAMQALPGVATGDDFQAEFSVRGSAFRHVGIVLDGVAVPLLLHAIKGRNDSGSLAMINSDVLDRAALLAGPHPLRHGDWIGATLEFGVREGSRDRLQLRAAVSGTSASTVLEGPLTRSKRGSWLLSLRKSYVGWLIRKLDPEIDSTIGFWDGQAKLAFDLTPRQHLEVLAVFGQATYWEDQTSVANGIQQATSRGTLASLAWRYAHDRLLVTQRVSWTSSASENTGLRGQQLAVGDASSVVGRADALWSFGGSWTIDGGARYERTNHAQTFRRFATTSGGGLRVTALSARTGSADYATVWGQLARRTTASGLAAGARASRAGASGRHWVSPWVLAERSLGPVTLRASAGVSHQPPALEYSSSSAEPLVPERARAADLSLEYRLGSSARVQVTAFAREEFHVLRPIGEEQAVNGRFVPQVTFPAFAGRLDGTSRGVDVLVQRRAPTGPTGWIAYTWSRSRYHDLVSGERFDGDYDQRHTLNVFLLQRLSYRSAVNAKLRIGSNFPLVGYFSGTIDDMRISDLRNQVRLPWYVRLDLRANRTVTFDRRRLTLFVEVVNALGRRNLGQTDGTVFSNLQAVGFAERMIPRVPSIGFLIEF